MPGRARPAHRGRRSPARPSRGRRPRAAPSAPPQPRRSACGARSRRRAGPHRASPASWLPRRSTGRASARASRWTGLCATPPAGRGAPPPPRRVVL